MQFLQCIKYWKEQLENTEYESIQDVGAVEQLVGDLHELRQEIEDCFQAVSSDSKALLAELQKPARDYDDEFLKSPEYSEAVSHVMDIYLEVHEHHRQLTILWERRQALLKEYLHLCMFDQDSNQVSLRKLCGYSILIAIKKKLGSVDSS